MWRLKDRSHGFHCKVNVPGVDVALFNHSSDEIAIRLKRNTHD